MPIRVLLADDTLIAREGWKRILETAHDIEVVGQAELAVEVPRFVERLAPDVVLLDLKWAGDPTAGYSAIKEIRRQKRYVRIIAMTAHEELILDARRAGADAALSKDFTREQLLTTIRELALRPNAAAPLAGTLSHAGSLSTREREVIELIAAGKTDREIGTTLGIAEATAKNHVQHILEKLGANNRAHAAHIAQKLGLI